MMKWIYILIFSDNRLITYNFDIKFNILDKFNKIFERLMQNSKICLNKVQVVGFV